MPEALAPAKINLFLYVGEPRADGYHPVCTLMEKVSLYDRLAFEPSREPGVRLTGVGIPPGENTVERAAALLAKETGSELGATVNLVKEVPVAAGLAGGSSDAAAALKLMVSTFDLQISEQSLHKIALDVGADVPFFLEPGPQLAEGVGELLTPVSLPFDYAAVVITPPVEVSTARVYRLYDEMCGDLAAGFSRQCQQAKERLAFIRSPQDLAGILHNDLEEAAASICPEITAIKKELASLGALGSLMSGSGSSVFGLFADNKSAETAAGRLRSCHHRVLVVEPVAL